MVIILFKKEYPLIGNKFCGPGSSLQKKAAIKDEFFTNTQVTKSKADARFEFHYDTILHKTL